MEPANNIYHVPISIIIFGPSCSEGRPLQGRQETTTLAEGENKTAARLSLTTYPSFHRNWVNLTPEERKRITPFRLRSKGKIEQVPSCERRFKNKRGDYTCGKPINSIEKHLDQTDEDINNNGEFGMCVVMGYDTPGFEDCPYNERRNPKT